MAKEVNAFLKDEIMTPYRLPRIVVSDNATNCTAEALSEFSKRYAATWKNVMAYTPVFSGGAKRISGNEKKSLMKNILEYPEEWEEFL